MLLVIILLFLVAPIFIQYRLYKVVNKKEKNAAVNILIFLLFIFLNIVFFPMLCCDFLEWIQGPGSMSNPFAVLGFFYVFGILATAFTHIVYLTWRD